MDTNTDNTNIETKETVTEEKASMVNTVKETNYLYLAYYILSFVVLFFKIFVYKTDAMNSSTYRVGFMEFANGIGWFYYLANIVGLLSVFLKPLHFMEKLGAKVISIINLVISLIMLLATIPDAINPGKDITYFIGSGGIALGFWVILVFHAVAVLVFWYKFIQARRHKKDNK